MGRVEPQAGAHVEAQTQSSPGSFEIEVVYCPRPGAVELVTLQCELGCSLMDAVQRSGLLQRHPELQGSLQAGIWGRVQPLQTVLRAKDRVELYRPLTVDPKEARRLRYRKQRQSKLSGSQVTGSQKQ